MLRRRYFFEGGSMLRRRNVFLQIPLHLLSRLLPAETHIFLWRKKSGKKIEKLFLDQFSIISKIYIHIFWASGVWLKAGKMQIQEECNISQHKVNVNWNVDQSRINVGITLWFTKRWIITLTQLRQHRKSKFGPFVVIWMMQT